jgi:hypothetical protein
VVAVASPLDIAGCALWLDGADATSMFDATSGGSQVLPGGTIARWQDKSGNGRNATQSASLEQPTLTASALNGKTVVTFDGSNDGLGFSGGTRTQETWFVVWSQTGGSDTTQAVVSDGASGYGINIGSGAGKVFDSSWGSFSVSRLYFVYSGTGATLIAPNVTTVRRSSADGLAMFLDGANRPSSFTATTANATTMARLGSVSSGSNRLGGYIAEVVCYDSPLTTAQRASVEAYLATKWSISGVHAPATASSDPVGYWGDKSGNGRHAVQATAGNRPAISATNQGSRKALAFNVSTKNLVSPATVAQYVADATTSPKVFFAFVARPEGGGFIAYGSPTNPNSQNRIFYVTDYGSAGSHIVDFGAIPGARLAGVVGDEADGVGHVYSAFRDGAIMSVRRDGVEILRKTDCTGVYSDTSGTLAINVAEGAGGTASWCEFLTYAASMSAANITRIERYLANRWGITLAPQVSNADAQDWVNRVYANGGTVSSATAASVNTLCDSLESASLRDRFYRLNLFCGTGLNAALVPLYRGPSLGGTQYGNTTDTNFGSPAFLDVTNYTEATGLGAASGKYLKTGLTQAAVGLVCHLAFYDCVKATNGYANRIGSRGASDTHEHAITNLDVSTTVDYASNASAGVFRARATGYTETGAFWLGVNPTATSAILYKNGVSAATATPTARTAQSLDYWVFMLNNNGAIDSPMTTGRSGGYSIGLSMDATQAAAYNAAMQAFQTSLTRNAT